MGLKQLQKWTNQVLCHVVSPKNLKVILKMKNNEDRKQNVLYVEQWEKLYWKKKYESKNIMLITTTTTTTTRPFGLIQIMWTKYILLSYYYLIILFYYILFY